MNEQLARLERIYPNGKYVLIAKYNPEMWENVPYDSHKDFKAPLNRWKSKPLSYDEAQEAVDKGHRVGWIIPEGYVVIDIDNVEDPQSQEYIEKLLIKFEVKYNYNYSSRGIHILLRDPSRSIKSNAKLKCSLNIVIDTRANETGYIVLPCNDPHREWGKWSDVVEDIPYFLKPILNDKTESFIGMGDGDGRNNALFKWRTKLEQSHKLTKEEIEKSIRIINENLFAVPMPNNELFKTVLREKEVKEDVTEKENIYNSIAEDIIGRFDIISRSDNFYKFNGVYYQSLQDIDIERIIHFDVSKNIPLAGRREILAFLRVKTQIPPGEFDKDWYKIAVSNGILNLVTGELCEPNKSEYNTIYIPHAYNTDPDLYSPRVDQFMKEVSGGDPIKMFFLYQVAGYCLLKKNLFEKFFIFKGEGGTGKSTFMNLVHMMVGGDANCSHIGLADFDKDYYLASTMSKLVNIDDDVVDGKTLENTGRFKSLISGNIISVRQIYKEVVDFVPYVTCIFSCNKLPRIMDRTSGLYRRMVLVELNNKVEKPDPLFMTKMTEVDIEYFLYKAVQGIKVALEENGFRINQSEQDLLQMFKRRQSPLNEWLYEMMITLGDIVNRRPITLYNQFVTWCGENGYTKLPTNFTFKEDICQLYDVELDMRDEEGKLKQVFVKRGEYDTNWRPF